MLKTALALLVVLLAAAPRAESANTVAAQKLAALRASSSALALSVRPAYYAPKIEALAAQNVFSDPPYMNMTVPDLLAYLAKLDALQASIDADAATYASALRDGSNLVLTADQIPRAPGTVFFHGIDMWQYFAPRIPTPTPTPTPTPLPPAPTNIPTVITPPNVPAAPTPTPPPAPAPAPVVKTPPPAPAPKAPKVPDLAASYAPKLEKLDAKIEEAPLDKREKAGLSANVKNFATELKKDAKLTAAEAQKRFDKLSASVTGAIAAAKEKDEREKHAKPANSKP
jgi:hypothetical protein